MQFNLYFIQQGFFFKFLFIYLWLCWVFISVRGLSLVGGKWGPLFIMVRGPLTIAASLVVEHRLQMRRLSNCGSRTQLLRGMWESSQTRARTRVPCIGRQILNHCATREAQQVLTSYLFYTYQCIYVNSSLPIHPTTTTPHHHFPPWCPYVCSLHLCLYFCPANWFICTIFLGSTCMR